MRARVERRTDAQPSRDNDTAFLLLLEMNRKPEWNRRFLRWSERTIANGRLGGEPSQSRPICFGGGFVALAGRLSRLEKALW
jgi:hypothetical protein